MRYNKEEIESKILASPLFELDKKTHYNAYASESRKMLRYLYLYLMAENECKYGDYGLEIVEVSTRCITNFDGAKGEFLHYFNKAWKLEFSRIMMKKAEEDKYRGGHIPETRRRNLRKVARMIKARGWDVNSPNTVEVLIENTKLCEEEIRECIELYKISVVSDYSKDDDDNEFSLIDLFASTSSAEEEIIHSEQIIEMLENMDHVYLSLQERQREIFSDVFTSRLCEIIVGEQISCEKIRFINNEMIIEYVKTGKKLAQKEIAQRYGRDEASFSRTIKEFLKKLEVVKES